MCLLRGSLDVTKLDKFASLDKGSWIFKIKIFYTIKTFNSFHYVNFSYIVPVGDFYERVELNEQKIQEITAKVEPIMLIIDKVC